MHRRRKRPARALYATLAALVLIAGTWAFSASRPSGAPIAAADGALLSVAEECQRALGYPARTAADRAWLRTCVHALTPPSSTPSPSGSPTSSPFPTTAAPTTPPATMPPAPSTTAPTVTTTPAPTTVPPTSSPPAPAGCPPFPAFPDADCTGWQHTGVTLRTCHEADGEDDGHLMVAQVFDGCLMRGFFRIRAANIVIRNSRVEGALATHYSHKDAEGHGEYMGLFVVDTEITTAVENAAPIGDGNGYTCLRCHVHHTTTGLGGGYDVRVIDSYVHDMTYTEGAHHAAVGWAYGSGQILHNNLDCSRWNVPPGPQGCSAALSLYDEGRLDGVLVQNNLFNGAGEYCAYSGGPTGKNVQFIDNRFGLKYHPQCGNSGPLHSWYPSNEGYVWRGNAFTDGRPIIR